MNLQSLRWGHLSRAKVCEVKRLDNRGEYECRVIQSESKNYYLCYEYDTSMMMGRSIAQLKHDVEKYTTLKSPLFTSLYKICHGNQTESKKSVLCLLAKYNEQDEVSLDKLINKIEINLSEMIENFKQALMELSEAGLRHNFINLEAIYWKKKQLKLAVPMFASIERQRRKRGQYNKFNNPLSPEIKEASTRIASDVWDAGIVLLQMALKENMKDIQFTKHSIQGKLQKIQNKQDRIVLQRMLNQDSHKRSDLNWVFNGLSTVKMNEKNNLRQVVRIPLFEYSSKAQFKNRSQRNNNSSRYELTNTIELTPNYQLQVKQSISNFLFCVVSKRQSQTLLERMYVRQQIPINKRNQLTYQLTEDGFIRIKTQKNTKKKLLSRNNPQQQKTKLKKNKEFPSNSMLYLKAFYNKNCIKTGQGFLICHNMILTTARFLYDRSTKFPSLQIQILHERTKHRLGSYSCHFPDKYMSCSEEEIANYDYGLIVLDGSVNQALQIGLLFDYDEEKLQEWAEQAGQSLQYCFEVNGNTYKHQQLNHSKSKVRNLNTSQKDEGCPLMIQFENGQFLATGIALSNKKCLLFTAEQITNIYRWASEAPDLKQGRQRFHYSFRAFSADKFAFWHPAIELQFPTSMECSNQTFINLLQCQELQLAGFVYERVVQSLPPDNLNVEVLKKVIMIYEVQYGEDYPNLACLYVRLGIRLSQKAEIAESLQLFLKAERILQQNTFNRHFYSVFLLKLAYLYEVNMKMEEVKGSLMRSIKMSQHNNYWWCLERSNFFYGKVKIASESIPEGIPYIKKSTEINEKYLEGGRNPASFIFLAGYHFDRNQKLQGLLLLEKSFETMNYDSSMRQTACNLFDAAARLVVQGFNCFTSEPLIQVVHRIVNQHLQSRMQLLTEMQIKNLV